MLIRLHHALFNYATRACATCFHDKTITRYTLTNYVQEAYNSCIAVATLTNLSWYFSSHVTLLLGSPVPARASWLQLVVLIIITMCCVVTEFSSSDHLLDSYKGTNIIIS